MGSIGVKGPYQMPDNEEFTEDDARKIINSWFNSSP